MRTTEDQARADAALVDTHPEMDRRLIRCVCGHSLDAHRQEVTPATFPWTAPVTCGRTDCPCARYRTRPAPWRVTFRPTDPDGPALISLWPWLITSPRGHVVHSSTSRTSADQARQNLGLPMAEVSE